MRTSPLGHQQLRPHFAWGFLLSGTVAGQFDGGRLKPRRTARPSSAPPGKRASERAEPAGARDVRSVRAHALSRAHQLRQGPGRRGFRTDRLGSDRLGSARAAASWGPPGRVKPSRGERCIASGGSPAYWAYPGDPTTRRSAVPGVGGPGPIRTKSPRNPWRRGPRPLRSPLWGISRPRTDREVRPYGRPPGTPEQPLPPGRYRTVLLTSE